MKSLFYFITSMLVFVPSHAQEVNVFPTNLMSQQKVKTQTLYEYDYVNGKPESKGTKAKVVKYDEKGNNIEEVNYRVDGKVHYIVKFRYDDKGNKVEYVRYNAYDMGSEELQVNYKQNIKHDSRGNVVEEMGYNGIENFRVVYNYTPAGKLAEVNYFNVEANGKKTVLDEKRVLKYTGNISNVKVYNGQNVMLFRLKNIYSISGKILEENRIELDSTVSKRVIYLYDKNDKCISETKYIAGKLASKITRIYNTKGQLQEVNVETSDGDKYITNQYTYSDKENLIEELSRSDKNKEFSKSTYKYNDAGLCTTIDSYYAAYKQQVLSVYTYEYY
jgi:hypothetical protein